MPSAILLIPLSAAMFAELYASYSEQADCWTLTICMLLLAVVGSWIALLIRASRCTDPLCSRLYWYLITVVSLLAGNVVSLLLPGLIHVLGHMLCTALVHVLAFGQVSSILQLLHLSFVVLAYDVHMRSRLLQGMAHPVWMSSGLGPGIGMLVLGLSWYLTELCPISTLVSQFLQGVLGVHSEAPCTVHSEAPVELSTSNQTAGNGQAPTVVGIPHQQATQGTTLSVAPILPGAVVESSEGYFSSSGKDGRPATSESPQAMEGHLAAQLGTDLVDAASLSLGLPREVVARESSESDHASRAEVYDEDEIVLQLALDESIEDARGQPYMEWEGTDDAFANPTGGAGIYRVNADSTLERGESFNSYDSSMSRAIASQMLALSRRVASWNFAHPRHHYLVSCLFVPRVCTTQPHMQTMVPEALPVPTCDAFHFRILMKYAPVKHTHPRQYWGRLEAACRARIAVFVGVVPDEAMLG